MLIGFIMFVSGVGMVLSGAWSISTPLGMIASGMFLAFIGWRTWHA